MLVGMTNIDTSKLPDACKSVEKIIAFSDSLVPPYFSHRKEIIDNQRYITAVAVRNLYANDYNKWKPLCTGLLEGVRVTGSVNDLYSCDELLRACDTKAILTFLEKEV